MFSQLSNLLKLRIGFIMMLTALVAMAITPGREPSLVEMLVLSLAVLISAGAAGAFNQYYEVDLDARAARTCTRPFVTGYFTRGPVWLLYIGLLLIVGVVPAALERRRPEVTVGFSGSKGTAFLLQVSPADSRRALATFPVRPLERRSSSISAVSVPPETISKPRSIRVAASVRALASTAWA